MQRIVWLLIFFLFGTSVFCQVTEVTKLTEEELKAKGWKLGHSCISPWLIFVV